MSAESTCSKCGKKTILVGFYFYLCTSCNNREVWNPGASGWKHREVIPKDKGGRL